MEKDATKKDIIEKDENNLYNMNGQDYYTPLNIQMSSSSEAAGPKPITTTTNEPTTSNTKSKSILIQELANELNITLSGETTLVYLFSELL